MIDNLDELVDAAPEPIGASGRLAIRTDQQLYIIQERAIEALVRANDPPVVFRRGSTLARVGTTDDESAVTVEWRQHGLAVRLSEVADWTRLGVRGTEIVADTPPAKVVGAMLEMADTLLGVPVLEQIVTAPTFGADGSLTTNPGYAPGSRTWFDPRHGIALREVPECPSAADVSAARQMLLVELLGDFPFAETADRANAVGLAVLPFVRPMIPDATPLHLIHAPTPGTGKGLLAHAMMIPARGAELAPMPEGENEAEWRKKITGALLNGAQVHLFDNVNSTLSSAALAAVLTSTLWEDRILGGPKVVTLPNRVVWIATANNPEMSKEIARRSISIRLDATSERPWQRTGFRHPDLLTWARKHRGELVWSILVLVRHWLASGRRPGKQSLGSYESWAKIIGGILDAAKIEGFLGNLKNFYELSDGETNGTTAFVAAWWEKFRDAPVTAQTLVSLAHEYLEIGNSITGDPTKRLGRKLVKLVKTVHLDDTVQIVTAPGRVRTYRLVEINRAERM